MLLWSQVDSQMIFWNVYTGDLLERHSLIYSFTPQIHVGSTIIIYEMGLVK